MPAYHAPCRGCPLVLPRSAAIRAGNSARGLPVHAGQLRHLHSIRRRIAFARYGLRTLIVARFVPGLSTLASPMAGAGAESVQSRFLPYELGGALLVYTVAYVVLGWMFANQLGVIVQVLEDAGIRR